MFSIPFAVASAVVRGRLGPQASDEEALRDTGVHELARRVEVRLATDLEARLPDERPVRVTVLAGDERLIEERPNPVGDSDYRPLDEQAMNALLEDLLGGVDPVERLGRVVDRLFAGERSSILALLADPLSAGSAKSPTTNRS
jgi:2-methylcitrate dehydratase PrpD